MFSNSFKSREKSDGDESNKCFESPGKKSMSLPVRSVPWLKCWNDCWTLYSQRTCSFILTQLILTVNLWEHFLNYNVNPTKGRALSYSCLYKHMSLVVWQTSEDFNETKISPYWIKCHFLLRSSGNRYNHTPHMYTLTQI